MGHIWTTKIAAVQGSWKWPHPGPWGAANKEWRKSEIKKKAKMLPIRSEDSFTKDSFASPQPGGNKDLSKGPKTRAKEV